MRADALAVSFLSSRSICGLCVSAHELAMEPRRPHHFLKAKRDDVGAVDREQDVAQEIEILRCTRQILRPRRINVPRDAERSNGAKCAEVGLAQVEFGVCDGEAGWSAGRHVGERSASHTEPIIAKQTVPQVDRHVASHARHLQRLVLRTAKGQRRLRDDRARRELTVHSDAGSTTIFSTVSLCAFHALVTVQGSDRTS